MKYLVITTIQSPTLALFKYRDILLELGWSIVVVGDLKSPSTFDLPGIDYLNLEKQQELFGSLAYLVPLNHYARKNLGYLYAIQKGAEAIAESDDDNIPYDDKYPNFLPTHVNASVLEVKDTVNVYSYFTDKKIWPRGIPLDKVGSIISQEQIAKKEVTCYVQQGLADLDPDVDAIYRLTTSQGDVIFDCDKKLALGSGCYSPFNTQNTLFYREAFPLMLLPISVHSRVTDIWRSYMAQRLLWCMDSSVLFLSPSVYQQRNEHNLLKDFQHEIPLYTQANNLIDLLEKFNSDTKSPIRLISELYSFLHQHNFLDDLDVRLCDLWIKAISSYL